MWTAEFWNLLHIVSPNIEPKYRSSFYSWLVLLSEHSSDRLAYSFLEKNKQKYLNDTYSLVDLSIDFQSHLDSFSPTAKQIKSYYKKEHITRDVWGPYLWRWLHHSSFTLDSLLFQQLLDEVIQWITCAECRIHASEYKEKNPYTSDMKTWMIAFHNNVSERLNSTYGTKKKIYITPLDI